jgi:hypothetical protein
MAVSAQGLTVHPSLGNSVNSLITAQAKKLGNNSCRCDLDEDDMIKADPVERIKEGNSSLNFMGLNHGLENISDSKGLSLTSKMVRDSQDSSKIVRWVTP